MNQTEFGNQIAELRKNKGITQAELAEQCNLNIRSIQRIESGKVLPRAYTIKRLSEVLDHELFLPAQKNKHYGGKDMEKKLKTTWIAGIIMFAAMIPESIYNIARYYDGLSFSDLPIYFSVSIISAVTFIIFMYGFVLIGKNLKNTFIIVCAYLFIFTTIIEYGLDFVLLENTGEELKSIAAIFSVIYGFISIFFGVGLMRLESIFGSSAKIAGVLEIVAGITFVIIILFFIGLFLLIPITILEIMILYKASNKHDWLDDKTALA